MKRISLPALALLPAAATSDCGAAIVTVKPRVHRPGVNTMVAYDQNGPNIQHCFPLNSFQVSSTSLPDCLIAQRPGVGEQYRGKIRLQAATPSIRRVVFASWLGSAHVTCIQYNHVASGDPPPCTRQ